MSNDELMFGVPITSIEIISEEPKTVKDVCVNRKLYDIHCPNDSVFRFIDNVMNEWKIPDFYTAINRFVSYMTNTTEKSKYAYAIGLRLIEYKLSEWRRSNGNGIMYIHPKFSLLGNGLVSDSLDSDTISLEVFYTMIWRKMLSGWKELIGDLNEMSLNKGCDDFWAHLNNFIAFSA
jgi:hypothetical protein